MAALEKAFRGMGHVAWLFSDSNSNTYTIALEEMGAQKEAHIVRW